MSEASRLRVGVKSDVGLVREGNEDAYLIRDPLFVVADGMGGHIAGDVASATAVDAISQLTDDSIQPGQLDSLVRDANAAVWGKAQADPSLAGMGTTCTVVLVSGGKAHIAHVGDSRAYLFRDGQLKQLTQDHTLVGRMVKEGRLRPEEAEHHPQRNVITRALGVDADVAVDTIVIDIGSGDRIVVSSDGLNSMVPRSEIERILQSNSEPQDAAEELVLRANEFGGEDNTTVVVVDVAEEPGDEEAKPPPEGEGTRVDTTPRGDIASRRHRLQPWIRIVLITVGVILAVVGIGYGAARYSLANSWFVGVDDEGRVTIFRGIPDEIVGFELKEEEETTDLTLEEVPVSRRAQVSAGFKVDSLDEARSYVENLAELRTQFGEETPTPETDKS